MIGGKVYRVATCDDSMGWVKGHLDDAPDGSLFLVDKLTHARGRDGRVWKVYEGQLPLTILLKPETFGDDISLSLNQLNMALTVGFLKPLLNFGIRLKWPNDFIYSDGKYSDGKKVGGMLLELVWRGTKPAGLIVGLGLNVNNVFDIADPLSATATSLVTLAQKPLGINRLLEELLGSASSYYQRWKEGDGSIYTEWLKYQHYLGKRISVHYKGGEMVEGVVEDILFNGDLQFRKESGNLETISFYVVEEILK